MHEMEQCKHDFVHIFEPTQQSFPHVASEVFPLFTEWRPYCNLGYDVTTSSQNAKFRGITSLSNMAKYATIRTKERLWLR